MAIVSAGKVEYYLDDRLKAKWDKLKNYNIIDNDEDRVYITDGRERAGKSLFTIQQAAYLDPTLNLDRICFDGMEFLEAIKKAKPGQNVIFDEAFRGLSSPKSRSEINSLIKTCLMESGQRNLIVWIVSPYVFLLDMYAALLRSVALFHVYKNKKGGRGYFKVFNEKKKAMLYQMGAKKGWSYSLPQTQFKGRFYGKYPFGDDFEAAYRAKKAASLQTLGREGLKEIDKNTEKAERSEELKKIFCANWFLLWKEITKGSQQEFCEYLAKINIEVSQQSLSRHIEEAIKASKVGTFPKKTK